MQFICSQAIGVTSITLISASLIFWESFTKGLLRFTEKYDHIWPHLNFLAPATDKRWQRAIQASQQAFRNPWLTRPGCFFYTQCTEPRPAQGELLCRWPRALTCPPQTKRAREERIPPLGINRISNLTSVSGMNIFICATLRSLPGYICAFLLHPLQKASTRWH